jgi:hypothetical protein
MAKIHWPERTLHDDTRYTARSKLRYASDNEWFADGAAQRMLELGMAGMEAPDIYDTVRKEREVPF